MRISKLTTLLVVFCASTALHAVEKQNSEAKIPSNMDLLIKSYPDTLSHSAHNMLHTFTNEHWLIDDGEKKDHQAQLNRPDIEDSLKQQYPLIHCNQEHLKNFDPGRVRFEPLMTALYGDSAAKVKASLTQIDWFGQTLHVTTRNGVNEALLRVRDELSQEPQLLKYLTPSAGTFNWRKISGTSRLSVHSFGAAIDLNTKYAGYWKWSKQKKGDVSAHKSRYPSSIIKAFEKHGFIWGGRWYHYDTMHFEYRPELINIARAKGCRENKKTK